jgi:hypothetical protein
MHNKEYYSLSFHTASIALSRAATVAMTTEEAGGSGCTRPGAQNFHALGFHFKLLLVLPLPRYIQKLTLTPFSSKDVE